MFILYTQWVSPHQIPLAKELVAILGVDGFRYFYTEDPAPHQLKWGWDKLIAEPWIEKVSGDDMRLRSCETLLTGIRDQRLVVARSFRGLCTLYMSERWLKPVRIGGAEGLGLPFPGWLKLFIPGYRRMVKRFVRWANGDPGARVLAIGPWAKGDFLRMGVRAEKLVDWGYFVEPSRFGTQVPAAHAELDETCVSTPRPAVGRHDGVSSSCDPLLRVLWAGRDIPLKHVRDIEKAVKLVNNKVEIVGGGGQRSVTFTKLTGVSPAEVRKSMREHDVFVFASNGYEGWGAVVSEALEEGMDVIGTWECGACPTLLPKERLYHCGDVRELARLLALEVEERGGGGQRKLPPCSIGEWTAKRAAERLCALARGVSG